MAKFTRRPNSKQAFSVRPITIMAVMRDGMKDATYTVKDRMGNTVIDPETNAPKTRDVARIEAQRLIVGGKYQAAEDNRVNPYLKTNTWKGQDGVTNYSHLNDVSPELKGLMEKNAVTLKQDLVLDKTNSEGVPYAPLKAGDKVVVMTIPAKINNAKGTFIDFVDPTKDTTSEKGLTAEERMAMTKFMTNEAGVLKIAKDQYEVHYNAMEEKGIAKEERAIASKENKIAQAGKAMDSLDAYVNGAEAAVEAGTDEPEKNEDTVEFE